jgi:hypothetical protein
MPNNLYDETQPDISSLENIFSAAASENSKSVKLLERAVEVLKSIDKSIDFLAAAMTGMDPLEIEMGQVALGRLARPQSRLPAPAREQENEIDENIIINNTLLEEIIEEEVYKILNKG